MLAKEFIYERLQFLSRDFPSVQIKYRFNEWAKTHIVELTPVESYYMNTALESAWIDLVKDFMEKYPADDISFVSTDSMLRIEEPEFSFNVHALQHFDIPAFNFEGTQGRWAQVFNTLTENVAFEDIVIPHKMTFSIPIGEYPFWDTIYDFNFSNFREIAQSLIPFVALEDDQNTIHFKEQGASTLPDSPGYAMAA